MAAVTPHSASIPVPPAGQRARDGQPRQTEDYPHHVDDDNTAQVVVQIPGKAFEDLRHRAS